MLIKKQYTIHEQTLAIIPAAAIDYHTIAIETTKKTYVKRTPLEIIQASCIKSGATYHGRRLASQLLLGSKQKVPILITERPARYIFPTQSPKNAACSWIIANHIIAIKPYPHKSTVTLQTTIHFKDQQTLHLIESPYQINQQYRQSFALHQALKSSTRSD